MNMDFNEAYARSAKRLWEEDYRDEDRRAISQIFRENGYQWHLNRLGTDGRYNGADGLEYCGHTAAVAGLRIGDYAFNGRCVDVQLDPDLARIVFPSTYKLSKASKWESAGFRRDPCVFGPSHVTRGALCTIDAPPPFGSHIVIAIGEPDDRGEFPTIEGNAYGVFPTGTKGKGVVRRTRNRGEVCVVYQFGPEHTQGSYELTV